MKRALQLGSLFHEKRLMRRYFRLALSTPIPPSWTTTLAPSTEVVAGTGAAVRKPRGRSGRHRRSVPRDGTTASPQLSFRLSRRGMWPGIGQENELRDSC